MAIITFLSDFGYKDHYTAAVKARILQLNPAAQIIDISHNISLNNVIEAAFVLKNVYNDFPKGTVHIVAVNENHPSPPIAIQLNGHYFISRDSGVLGLISDKMPSQMAVIQSGAPSSFTSKNIFAKAAVLLSNGTHLSDIGAPAQGINIPKLPEVRIMQNEIAGQIMFVDAQGNLITNITKNQVSEVQNNRSLEVSFERLYLRKISNTYTDVDPGDAVCFFNDNSLLEIAVNDGNASKLFGLEFGSNVKIYFK